ncbi:hypothetical protein D3C84_711440 [compost metagenome]
MIGDGAAGEDQVAGPCGDVARLGGGRAWGDALAAAAVVDAQAVAVAGGVLQQVGADGDGQRFGGFSRFGFGFSLQDARDIFFAVQTGDQFIAHQKQFAITVDVELVAVQEFDAKITLQRTGRNHAPPCKNPPDRITRKQTDFDAAPHIQRPFNRQHRSQRLTIIAQHHLTGPAPTRPDRCAIGQPTGNPTLTRRWILITQPAPGFHPQPTTEFAHDIAVGGIQHHIQQHSPCLILRGHHGQHFKQFSHRHSRGWLQ